MNSFYWVAEQLGEILRTLTESGYELPFYFVYVSRNGGMMFGRYFKKEDEPGLANEIIEQSVPGHLVLPMHLMFVDASGRAAHVEIKGPNDCRFSVN
jgi:hypothetical protein